MNETMNKSHVCATAVTRALKPDLRPSIDGAPSVVQPINFPQSSLFSLKKLSKVSKISFPFVVPDCSLLISKSVFIAFSCVGYYEHTQVTVRYLLRLSTRPIEWKKHSLNLSFQKSLGQQYRLTSLLFFS